MPESDWAQFIPDLIIAVIGVLFAIIVTGTIACFRSERFKTWLSKLLANFALGLKWLVEKWYFFLPLCIVIILGTITFRIYADWKIVAFSFLCYLMGLLGWRLSNRHQILRGRNRAINGIKTKFLAIPLPAGIGNSYLKNRYIDPPVRDVVLGGAQFRLKQDSLIFDTNEHISSFLPRSDGGKEVDYRLPEPANQVKSVYLLINSGNSKNIYVNEVIGKIRLIFKDAPPIVVELVLGQNIREWCPGNSGEYVRETSSPSTMNVWMGMSKNGANAVIDCLKIPVYECMRNCSLEKIVFVYKPTQKPPDTMGVHFSVFAISLEIESRM